MKSKTHFCIFALIISLVSLGFSLLRITPFSINEDTYIGLLATFIGISVTLLIGFQIINFFEVKKEFGEIKKTMEELRKTKEEILNTQKEISRIENESQECLDIIAAKFLSLEQESCVDAFLVQQVALISSLKAHRKDFSVVFSGLKRYISKMQPGFFATGTNVQIDINIDNYIERAKKNDSQIKEFENYCSIKYEYEHILKCFFDRMENARKNLTVSTEELKELWR